MNPNEIFQFYVFRKTLLTNLLNANLLIILEQTQERPPCGYQHHNGRHS